MEESGRLSSAEGDSGRRVEVIAPDEAEGGRLDRVLADLLPDLSRSKLKRLISKGRVQVNGSPADKPSQQVEAGQSLVVDVGPEESPAMPRPQSIDLEIVHEDDDLVIVNKPAGLVVHAGAGEHDATLVNALLYRYGDRLSHIGGDERPGIVHRLDKGTSGVMAVARNDEAHEALSAQFAERRVEKEYAAVVYGCPRQSEGTVELPIGRDRTNRTKISPDTDRPRDAFTRWKVAEDLAGAALLAVWPKTGRTHQVRAHLAAIHHPCIGDLKYVGAQWKGLTDGRLRNEIRAFARPALHARRLRLDHPRSGDRLEFCSPLAADIEALLSSLRRARDEP